MVSTLTLSLTSLLWLLRLVGLGLLLAEICYLVSEPSKTKSPKFEANSKSFFNSSPEESSSDNFKVPVSPEFQKFLFDWAMRNQ